MNQVHDNDCKRVLDHLAAQAKRQGGEVLSQFQKAKDDESKRVQMIAAYKKASNEAEQLGLKTPQVQSRHLLGVCGDIHRGGLPG